MGDHPENSWPLRMQISLIQCQTGGKLFLLERKNLQARRFSGLGVLYDISGFI
jgi:hypothetical protein